MTGCNINRSLSKNHKVIGVPNVYPNYYLLCFLLLNVFVKGHILESRCCYRFKNNVVESIEVFVEINVEKNFVRINFWCAANNWRVSIETVIDEVTIDTILQFYFR